MWKAMSAAEKKPWEQKAQEQKDAYDKFIATPEGKKALEEKKSEKKLSKDDKAKKKMKQAVKAVDKDEKLKRPASAYFMWFNEKREEIQKKVGSKSFGEVGKKASEMWKGMKDAERKPWEDKAKAQKDAYDKYISSEEGMKALQAYKDEVSAIKSKRVSEPAAEAEEPAAKKVRKGKAGA